MQNAERPKADIVANDRAASARDTALEPVRVAVLGPLLVHGKHDVLVEPNGATPKALIVALALGSTRPVGGALSVDHLVDAVWSEEPPRQAKAALQTLVSRVRGSVADALISSESGGYALTIRPGDLDLARAESLGSQASHLTQSGDHTAALAKLDAALALWRGEPGADLPAGPLREQLIDVTARLRSQLLMQRAESLIAVGRTSDAAASLTTLLTAEPLNERVVELQMRALAACGRTAEALAVFALLRQRLRTELGASPGAVLTALNTELLQTQAVAVTPASQRTIGIRSAPNQLIGRELDLAAIEQLLTESRLVTVLGAGGLGKTRVAQAIAQSSRAPLVVVVELASVHSNDDVTLALATTLGIRELAAGQRLSDAVARLDLRARVVAELSSQGTLLIVDNCEHVIDGAAGWVSDLLAAVPELRVLTTSRSPLELTAERVYALHSLAAEVGPEAGTREKTAGDERPTPNAFGPAVQLFVERANAARPGATLPLDVVARLCNRLDGLPLAIELAAARVRSLSVEQIEARLQNRFALLTGGDRAAPERHQTLQAVIEWSWRLLSPAEQGALARLSLFADGFSAEAAETVIAEPRLASEKANSQASALTQSAAFDTIDALVAQSLLTVSDEAASSSVRYRMLETVREFGKTQLVRGSEYEAAHQGVRSWARNFALAGLSNSQGPGQVPMFHSVTREQDNLVMVLRDSIDARDAQTVFDVFALLAYYWTVRSAHSEVVAFAPAVLDATRGYSPDADHLDTTVSSLVLIAATGLFVSHPGGTRALARVRALLQRDEFITPRLRALAQFLIAATDLDDARERLNEMRNDPDPATALLGNLFAAQFAENDGEPLLAAHGAERAWQLAGQIEDTWASAMSAMMMAQISSQSAHVDDALRWSVRARTGLLALDVPDDLQQLDWIHAASLLRVGRIDEAREIFARFVLSDRRSEHAQELRSIGQVGLAEAARLEGDFREAQRLFAEAIESFRKASERSSPWFQMALSGYIAAQIVDGSGDAADLAKRASALRARVLGYRRARPEFNDKPVLGTSAIGLALWALTQNDMEAIGLELFALADGLQGRQDLPSLNRAIHSERIVRMFGADALAAAQASVAGLTLNERAARAYELLREPEWNKRGEATAALRKA